MASIPFGEDAADALGDHFDGHGVIAAFRDDDIRVALAGLDEAQVHRADGAHVLLDDGSDAAAALLRIAFQAADKAHVRVDIHEDLDITERAQAGLGKDEDAFDEDDGPRRYGASFGCALVAGEIVARDVHALAGL